MVAESTLLEMTPSERVLRTRLLAVFEPMGAIVWGKALARHTIAAAERSYLDQRMV
jgi:hypothetical protein